MRLMVLATLLFLLGWNTLEVMSRVFVRIRTRPRYISLERDEIFSYVVKFKIFFKKFIEACLKLLFCSSQFFHSTFDQNF